MASLFRKRITRFYNPQGKRVSASEAKSAGGDLRQGYRREAVKSDGWYGRYVDELGIRREVLPARPAGPPYLRVD